MTHSSSSLEGSVALVTGAGSGIGRATSLLLAEKAARVVGVDISPDGLAATAAAAEASTGTLDPHVADISDRDACHAAVAEVVDGHGRLDILCNVAGVTRPGLTPEVTRADWDFVLGVNLEGTFWCCQAAIPHLLETDGVIVNTASNTAIQGLAYFAAYCASKGGVIALTRALAMEYARTGLRVNAVAPGGTDTPLNMGVARDLPKSVELDLVTRGVCLRGNATPEEIARVIVWVASPEAKALHGAVIHADHGLTAG